MTHYTEEDLILYYYDEASRRGKIGRHLDECDACGRAYAALAATLNLVTAPDGPERGDQYGLEVWQRIRHQLPEQDAWWPTWLGANRAAMAGAIVVLMVAAFSVGRRWSDGPAPTPGTVMAVPSLAGTPTDDDARQRVLLTSVADYLDRSERILTDIMNTPEGGDLSRAQQRAGDLVATSRLYRQDAVDAGEYAVADVLDEVERNLVEVVHSPSRATAAHLDDIRRRIDAAALLFKVRVLGHGLRQRERPGPARARTFISHLSEAS